MRTATYECTPAFGWGARGPATSGIRHEARRLGLELEPFPWAKLHEPVAACPIKVRGEHAAVVEFEQAMRAAGYDDRAESHVQTVDTPPLSP